MNGLNAGNVQTPQEALNVARFVHFSLINSMVVVGAIMLVLQVYGPIGSTGSGSSGGTVTPAPPPPGSGSGLGGIASGATAVNPAAVWFGAAALGVVVLAGVGAPQIKRRLGGEIARDPARSPRDRAAAFLKSSILYGALVEFGGVLGIVAGFLGEPVYLTATFLAGVLMLYHFPRLSMFEPRNANPYAMPDSGG